MTPDNLMSVSQQFLPTDTYTASMMSYYFNGESRVFHFRQGIGRQYSEKAVKHGTSYREDAYFEFGDKVIINWHIYSWDEFLAIVNVSPRLARRFE